MAASSTCCSLSVSNIALLSARCTGFAKVKGQNDYAFIVDLEWSDYRSMSIKRTYTEFQAFHGNLVKLFPELKQTIKSKLRLQTTLKENMTSLFSKDKRGLAESREQMLDLYLVNLLKQPERIRRSNIVLSFFEPTDSDPKPCKSTAPDTKSDSGIDLTGDRAPSKLNEQDEICETDGHYSTGTASTTGTANTYDSDDDYDGDTSGTETDNDPFDEDYFLDVGINELMLQSTENLELSNPDSSTWCSNMNKFANILNTLPSTDNLASRQYTAMTSVTLSDDEHYEEITKSILDVSEVKENSDTESQMLASDSMCEGLESDDEFMYKPVAQTDMNHYYLSATTDTSIAE